MKYRSTKSELEGLDSKPLRELKYFFLSQPHVSFLFIFYSFFYFTLYDDYFFFLKQGEYIAPEKIQNVYLRSPFVAQAFVVGNSFKVC